jgi:hypothetical protein
VVEDPEAVEPGFLGGERAVTYLGPVGTERVDQQIDIHG